MILVNQSDAKLADFTRARAITQLHENHEWFWRVGDFTAGGGGVGGALPGPISSAEVLEAEDQNLVAA